MSVVAAVDSQGMLQSYGSSASNKEKKKKVTFEEKPKVAASKPAKLATDKPEKSVPDSRSAKYSADARIGALDQKWSDRFNRLEAIYWQEKPEPTFQTVKLTPMHTPPVGSVKAIDPFSKPADQPQSFSRTAD